MSRRVRPRRRRVLPVEAAPEHAAAVSIEAGDRLDSRAALNCPAGLEANPEALLAWARQHAPAFVLDDAAAERRARARVEREAWHELPVHLKAQALRAYRRAVGHPHATRIPPREFWPSSPEAA
ncbi:MAG TPA: hypothetical protein VNS09_07315 [Solirubrobacter sp.]|nr:hypothetical protein [Solirubrobacter sp.]